MTRKEKKMVKDIERMVRYLNRHMITYPSKHFIYKFIDKYAIEVIINNRVDYQILSIKDIGIDKPEIEIVLKDNWIVKKYIIFPGLFKSFGDAEYSIDKLDRLYSSRQEYDTIRFNTVLKAMLMALKDKLEGRYV